MSGTTASEQSSREAEPFGQMGISQFLLPALACVSLAGAVFSLVMWYRSYNIVDSINTEQPGTSWRIRSIFGRIFVTVSVRPNRLSGWEGRWNYDTAPMYPIVSDAWRDSTWKRVGIEWGQFDPDPNTEARSYWLRVKWPFVAMLASILPIARVVYVARRRRALAEVHHLCPECGYDLRSSRNYCPECGRPVARA